MLLAVGLFGIRLAIDKFIGINILTISPQELELSCVLCHRGWSCSSPLEQLQVSLINVSSCYSYRVDFSRYGRRRVSKTFQALLLKLTCLSILTGLFTVRIYYRRWKVYSIVSSIIITDLVPLLVKWSTELPLYWPRGFRKKRGLYTGLGNVWATFTTSLAEDLMLCPTVLQAVWSWSWSGYEFLFRKD